MKSPNPITYSAEQYPLRHVFQSVWERLKKVISRKYSVMELCCSPNENYVADIGESRDPPLIGRLDAEIRALLK